MPEIIISHDISKLGRILATVAQEAIHKTLDQVSRTAEREALRRFRRTTQSWTNKPRFETIREIGPTSYELLVGTDDAVYGYVDLGTRPHRIEPKGPWPLRFKWGGKGSYQAKTAPGVLGSWKGGPSGPMVHFRGVNHPGTKARGFTEQIRNEVGADAQRRMMALLGKELDKAIRVHGRGR